MILSFYLCNTNKIFLHYSREFKKANITLVFHSSAKGLFPSLPEFQKSLPLADKKQMNERHAVLYEVIKGENSELNSTGALLSITSRLMYSIFVSLGIKIILFSPTETTILLKILFFYCTVASTTFEKTVFISS